MSGSVGGDRLAERALGTEDQPREPLAHPPVARRVGVQGRRPQTRPTSAFDSRARHATTARRGAGPSS